MCSIARPNTKADLNVELTRRAGSRVEPSPTVAFACVTPFSNQRGGTVGCSELLGGNFRLIA